MGAQRTGVPSNSEARRQRNKSHGKMTPITPYLLRGSGGLFQLLMLRSDGESVDVNWNRDDQLGRASIGSSHTSGTPGAAADSTGTGGAETRSAGRGAPVSDAGLHALPFGTPVLKPDFHLGREEKEKKN